MFLRFLAASKTSTAQLRARLDCRSQSPSTSFTADSASHASRTKLHPWFEGKPFRQIGKFAGDFHRPAPIPLSDGCEFRCAWPRLWPEQFRVHERIKCFPGET